MADITFYTNPMSRGRIVHWLLDELGVPYDMKILDFEKGEHKTPAYLKINPMGKVPAIVHRGIVVTECGAICAYLADAYPKAGLAPAFDDPQRGTYLRWIVLRRRLLRARGRRQAVRAAAGRAQECASATAATRTR